jgi:hypothetical protein
LTYDQQGNPGWGPPPDPREPAPGPAHPDGFDQPPPGPAHPDGFDQPPPGNSAPGSSWSPGYGYTQPGYAPPASPPPPPGYPPSGYGYGSPTYGYAVPPYGYAPPAPRTDGTAIAALVCAIASFIVCPVIPAIVALALIPSSRRKVLASGGTVQGLGLLTAAKIIAWIHLGLAAAVLALIVALAIAGALSSNNSTTAFVRPLLVLR